MDDLHSMRLEAGQYQQSNSCICVLCDILQATASASNIGVADPPQEQAATGSVCELATQVSTLPRILKRLPL